MTVYLTWRAPARRFLGQKAGPDRRREPCPGFLRPVDRLFVRTRHLGAKQFVRAGESVIGILRQAPYVFGPPEPGQIRLDT